jgi:LPXTG-motif cell wall-anchored protein
LASTGAAVGGMALLAGLALVLGGGLVIGARRRRTTQSDSSES